MGTLDVDQGLLGDNWSRRDNADPEMQINIMNSRVTSLDSQQRDRWALAGDQLYADLDLSNENLPVGTRLSLGSAILEVTSPPHTGL